MSIKFPDFLQAIKIEVYKFIAMKVADLDSKLQLTFYPPSHRSRNCCPGFLIAIEIVIYKVRKEQNLLAWVPNCCHKC